MLGWRTDSSGRAGARNDVMLSPSSVMSSRAETKDSINSVEALKFLSIEIAEASCLGATCGQARCLTYISSGHVERVKICYWWIRPSSLIHPTLFVSTLKFLYIKIAEASLRAVCSTSRKPASVQLAVRQDVRALRTTLKQPTGPPLEGSASGMT